MTIFQLNLYLTVENVFIIFMIGLRGFNNPRTDFYNIIL